MPFASCGLSARSRMFWPKRCDKELPFSLLVLFIWPQGDRRFPPLLVDLDGLHKGGILVSRFRFGWVRRQPHQDDDKQNCEWSENLRER